MITQAQLDELFDAEVVDQDGDRVGALDKVYLDDATGDPAWGAVRSGWLGGRRVLCPLANAELVGSRIWVPYPADMLKGAPEILPDAHLSPGQEQQLYDYFAVDEGPAPSG